MPLRPCVSAEDATPFLGRGTLNLRFTKGKRRVHTITRHDLILFCSYASQDLRKLIYHTDKAQFRAYLCTVELKFILSMSRNIGVFDTGI
jgi:hypothetical protein